MPNTEPHTPPTTEPDHVMNEIKRAIRMLASEKPLTPSVMKTLSILGKLAAPSRRGEAESAPDRS
jgi:hypothetical protein